MNASVNPEVARSWDGLAGVPDGADTYIARQPVALKAAGLLAVSTAGVVIGSAMTWLAGLWRDARAGILPAEEAGYVGSPLPGYLAAGSFCPTCHSAGAERPSEPNASSARQPTGREQSVATDRPGVSFQLFKYT